MDGAAEQPATARPTGGRMAVYVVADLNWTDQAARAEYGTRAREVLARLEGRYVVAGGAPQPLEGDCRGRARSPSSSSRVPSTHAAGTSPTTTGRSEHCAVREHPSAPSW